MDTLKSKRREALGKTKLEGYANFKIGGDLPAKLINKIAVQNCEQMRYSITC